MRCWYLIYTNLDHMICLAAFQRDKLRVEILSLSFEPSSPVTRDKSVQQVYVEYRLLGVPMETTETPMSLRKPRRGEEIHYNFTRGTYVQIHTGRSRLGRHVKNTSKHKHL